MSPYLLVQVVGEIVSCCQPWTGTSTINQSTTSSIFVLLLSCCPFSLRSIEWFSKSFLQIYNGTKNLQVQHHNLEFFPSLTLWARLRDSAWVFHEKVLRTGEHSALPHLYRSQLLVSPDSARWTREKSGLNIMPFAHTYDAHNVNIATRTEGT